MTREEKLLHQNEKLEHMLRIFTISLHTVHDRDHLNGGARMMLASMGRACLEDNEKFRTEIEGKA